MTGHLHVTGLWTNMLATVGDNCSLFYTAFRIAWQDEIHANVELSRNLQLAKLAYKKSRVKTKWIAKERLAKCQYLSKATSRSVCS